MKPKVDFLRACVLATDRHTSSAILLRQIAYWHPRMKVRRNGVLWIAKSRAVWCEETGLSDEQCKDAFRVLRSLKLVETAQMKFGGKSIGHVRLTTEAEIQLGLIGPNGTTQEGPNGTTQGVPNGTTQEGPNGPTTPPPGGPNGPAPNTEITLTDNTTETTEHCGHSPAGVSGGYEKESQGEDISPVSEKGFCGVSKMKRP